MASVINIQSSDGHEFAVPVDVACCMALINSMVSAEVGGVERGEELIPLPEVRAKELSSIISFLQACKRAPAWQLVLPLRVELDATTGARTCNLGVPLFVSTFLQERSVEDLFALAQAADAVQLPILHRLCLAALARPFKVLGAEAVKALVAEMAPGVTLAPQEQAKCTAEVLAAWRLPDETVPCPVFAVEDE